MHVYENGIEVRTIPVSTGAPATHTFTPVWRGVVGSDQGSGFFGNTALYADYMWYLFPGPQGSILIHSVPYTYSGEVKVYDQLNTLGVKPVSLGCVRVSPEDAAWLKTWNPVDVSIEITRWSGQINRVVDETPSPE